jgi:hypothetical protein
MSDEWLTYEQVAERMNVSPEAARQKAFRGRWQRSKGNDGKARIRLPDGWTNGQRMNGLCRRCKHTLRR